MADAKDVLKVLMRYGREVQPYHGKRDPGLYTAICPGCGSTIRSTDPVELAYVEYAVTKRGSATFFHRDCMKKAWESKIPQNGG